MERERKDRVQPQTEEDELMMQSIATLKSQLYECHLRLGSVTKEKKKLEQKNEELQTQINKSTADLNVIQGKVKDSQRKIEIESAERQKLEQQNIELESQVQEAKQQLRDMQKLLKNVQQATEQLKIKHSHRDSELQRLLNENKTLKSKVVELEWKLRDQELNNRNITASKDEAIRRLQEQVEESQSTMLKAKEECVKLRGEMAMKESELESWKMDSQSRIEGVQSEFDRKVDQYVEETLRSAFKPNDPQQQGGVGAAAGGGGSKLSRSPGTFMTEPYREMNQGPP